MLLDKPNYKLKNHNDKLHHKVPHKNHKSNIYQRQVQFLHLYREYPGIIFEKLTTKI